MALSTHLLTFHKYAGAGNDFIIIDDRTLFFPCEDTALIKRLCHRNLGIGADGLILIQPSVSCTVRMRIFNADGSEAEMCGNGVRCLASYLNLQHAFTLETMQRLLHIEYVDDEISVLMGDPTDICWNALPSIHVMDTGVPHAVQFVEDVAYVDLSTAGHHLRFHPQFHPKGVNANFAHIDTNKEVHVRTYERGVEGETLACGTGATATALCAAHCHGLQSPIKVHTRSGDTLSISFEPDLTRVRMQGRASLIFSGTIKI